MAETDILNPVQGYWPELGGNPTWDYDYNRKKGNNAQRKMPRLGPWISRDIANAGHSFTWNWNNRPLAVIQRLERFYDDFKNGYFTLIDWDNGGRHYVGCFTEPPNVKQLGHLMFSVQGLSFQERPRSRMLKYPNDFTVSGHPLNVVDDDLNPRVALMEGAWVLQASPLAGAGASANDPKTFEAFNAEPAVGDWAQTQYTGWGFQMNLRLANTLGTVNIFLDGVEIVTNLDLSNGTSAFVNAGAGLQVNPPALPTLPRTVTVIAVNVQLDQHRVKIVASTPSASGGTSVVYPALEYIY
jgi:hypothetical protein